MMMIDYAAPSVDSTLSPDELLDEAIALGAYGPSGWIHDQLVQLLNNHGVAAYRKEFKQEGGLEEGIALFKKELSSGRPVFVSAIKGFTERDKFHSVLLIGYEEKDNELSGFYYHDPDNELSGSKECFVPIEVFRETWRRFAIFLH